MATERIIDLEHKRYADREYEGPVRESTAAAEAAKDERRRLAAESLRRIAALSDDPRTGSLASDVAKNVLILLGLDE